MSTKKRGGNKKKKPIADLPSGVGVCRISNGDGGEFWRVRLGSRFTSGAVQIRNFPTLEGARSWIDENKGQRQEIAALGLSSDQLADAKRAVAKLPAGLTLEQAVDIALKYTRPSGGEIGFDAAVKAWLDERRSRPLAAVTRNSYRISVSLFTAAFPRLKVHQVSPKHIEDFVDDDDWQPATVGHHLRNLRCFFGWCVKKKYMAINPAVSIPEPDVITDTAILTPQQAADLLTSCSTALQPSVAIGLFAGLRSAEIQRLQWEQVGNTEIEIRAHITKTRRMRMVPINDTLKAWLDLMPLDQRSGPVAPVEWREEFAAATAAAGWKDDKEKSTWPRNAMRHSFGTYRYASVRNEAQVSAEMGNSPDMVHSHYRRNVAATVATQYWSIRPASAAADGKVVAASF